MWIKQIVYKIAVVAVSASVISAFPAFAGVNYAKKAAEDGVTTICIDAGHGGSNSGACATYNGISVIEKEVNLKLAKMLKEELSNYKNVQIIMTRTDDTELDNAVRARFGQTNYADYIISVHNNQCPQGPNQASGCCVLIPVSNYQPSSATVANVSEASEQLGLSIIAELQQLGLKLTSDQYADNNGGLVRRPHSPEGWARNTVYNPDGSIADYYGLIRRGIQAGIPTIIVEHAYIDNQKDYEQYLSTNEKLRQLAKADAKGIAAALHLEKIESTE